MLTIMSFNQWMIGATGLLAIVLLTFGNSLARRLAPLPGLIGQVFWIIEALDTHALGMLVVTLAYTVIWIGALWRSLCTARDALDGAFLASDLPEGYDRSYGGSGE